LVATINWTVSGPPDEVKRFKRKPLSITLAVAGRGWAGNGRPASTSDSLFPFRGIGERATNEAALISGNEETVGCKMGRREPNLDEWEVASLRVRHAVGAAFGLLSCLEGWSGLTFDLIAGMWHQVSGNG